MTALEPAGRRLRLRVANKVLKRPWRYSSRMRLRALKTVHRRRNRHLLRGWAKLSHEEQMELAMRAVHYWVKHTEIPHE